MYWCLPLLLHEPAHAHLPGPPGNDVALVVDSDTFGHAGLWSSLRNKGYDFAILEAADANPLLERHICGSIVSRLVIGDVEHVVLVDVDAARPAKLSQFRKIFAVLIEYLN